MSEGMLAGWSYESDEHFKAAVRAVHEERKQSGCPGHERGAICPNCSINAVRAALPHLDRMFRERYAAALEARAPHHISDGEAWYLNAAAFLRREPTL